ncbi:MAG: hypothetical protein PUE80_03370 [bacterium]|nr:hypothetical protein [bacterium]
MPIRIIISTLSLFIYLNTFATQPKDAKEYYLQSYSEITNMLEGQTPLSIKRAVYLAEWAFLEGKVDYEKDFIEPIKTAANYLRRLITVNHWDKFKTAKQIALCNYFFYPCSGNAYKPFEYEFTLDSMEDDWHYQLVSRAIKTHKGQCHSLPWAFKLYAEELGASVFLTHAPRHCYIMYKDEDSLFPEQWINVEVTTHQYQPSFWIKDYFAIKDSAIVVGTYMTPITDIQTVACQLADLAFSYYVKFNIYDEFTLKCVERSLKYYPKNPNAIIIMKNSLEALLKAHLEQNGYLCDAFTDYIDIKITQCMRNLKATYWTEETEELKRKWQLSPIEIDKLKKE